MSMFSNLLGRIFPRKEKDEGLALERELAREEIKHFSSMDMNTFSRKFESLMIYPAKRGHLTEADMKFIFSSRRKAVEDPLLNLSSAIALEEVHIATALRNACALAKTAIIEEVSASGLLDVEFISFLAKFTNACRMAISNADIRNFMKADYLTYLSGLLDFQSDPRHTDAVNKMNYRLSRIKGATTRIEDFTKYEAEAENEYQKWAQFVWRNHITLSVDKYITEEEADECREYLDKI